MDRIVMDYIPSRISFFALIEYLVGSGCGLQDRKSRRELKQFRYQMEKRSGYWSPESSDRFADHEQEGLSP